MSAELLKILVSPIWTVGMRVTHGRLIKRSLQFQKADYVECSVCWCFVLMGDNYLTRDLTYDRQCIGSNSEVR